MADRLAVLNRIRQDYYLPLDLYDKLNQSIKFEFNKDRGDYNGFLEDLPHKLKLEVSMYIHDDIYK